MKLRYKLALVLIVLGSVFCLGRCRSSTSSNSQAPVLPKADNEQIQINPLTHKLTIINKNGVKTETLPDRVSTVDIEKDGTVKLTAPQFGIERLPFIGLGYSDALRGSIGVDLAYFKKLDLGLGLSDTANVKQVRAFAHVSYNIYDNVHLGLSYDNRQSIGAIMYLRF